MRERAKYFVQPEMRWPYCPYPVGTDTTFNYRPCSLTSLAWLLPALVVKHVECIKRVHRSFRNCWITSHSKDFPITA